MYAAPMQNFLLEFALEKLQCEVKSLFEEKGKKAKKKKKLCVVVSFGHGEHREQMLFCLTLCSALNVCIAPPPGGWMLLSLLTHSFPDNKTKTQPPPLGAEPTG